MGLICLSMINTVYNQSVQEVIYDYFKLYFNFVLHDHGELYFQFSYLVVELPSFVSDCRSWRVSDLFLEAKCSWNPCPIEFFIFINECMANSEGLVEIDMHCFFLNSTLICIWLYFCSVNFHFFHYTYLINIGLSQLNIYSFYLYLNVNAIDSKFNWIKTVVIKF